MKSLMLAMVLAVAACAYGAGSERQEVAPGTIGIAVDSGPDGRVVISAVAPNGPAARAGLRAGDIVMSCDGRDVSSTRQFEELVLGAQPGSVARVRVRRGGEPRTVEVPVEELPIAADG